MRDSGRRITIVFLSVVLAADLTFVANVSRGHGPIAVFDRRAVIILLLSSKPSGVLYVQYIALAFRAR